MCWKASFCGNELSSPLNQTDLGIYQDPDSVADSHEEERVDLLCGDCGIIFNIGVESSKSILR